MNLISFSLYGTAPRYWVGAMQNAIIAYNFWPGWICRFYVDQLNRTTEALGNMENCQVFGMKPSQPNIQMFWRFHAASDPAAKFVIFRDADSRLSKREHQAVDEWIRSGCNFHVIRDHPNHFGVPMRGGLWGVKGGHILDIGSLINLHCHHKILAPRHEDEAFLTEVIWPQVDTVRFHQCPHHFTLFIDDYVDFTGQSWDEANRKLN